MLLSTDVSQCGEAARLVIVMFYDVAGQPPLYLHHRRCAESGGLDGHVWPAYFLQPSYTVYLPSFSRRAEVHVH